MNPNPTTRADEELIIAFSTHWIKYGTPIVVYIVLTGISMLLFTIAYLSGSAPVVSTITFALGGMILLVSHHWFFYKIMSESLVEIIITNRRLIYLEECLLICDDMHEVTLERIRAVEAHKRGLMENLFRYGSLWFDTGGSSIESSRSIPLVPHPHRHAREIARLMKQA